MKRKTSTFFLKKKTNRSCKNAFVHTRYNCCNSIYDGNLPLGKCLQGVSSRRRKPLSNAAVKTILSLQSEPKYLECLHQTMTFCPCSLYNKHVVLIYYPWIEQTENAKNKYLHTYGIILQCSCTKSNMVYFLFAGVLTCTGQRETRRGVIT